MTDFRLKRTKKVEGCTVPAGLESLLDKDWRGRGFDQDVDQLIRFFQSDKSSKSYSQVCLSTAPLLSHVVHPCFLSLPSV